jgi:molybdopterin-binding protein
LDPDWSQLIEKIVSDKVVSEVVIRTAAGTVTSVIATGSVQRMNLKEGDNVFCGGEGHAGVG